MMIWVASIALLFTGLLAGTFLGSTLVEHSAHTLTGLQWFAYKQAKEITFGAVMPPFLLLTMLLLGAAAATPSTRADSWTFGVSLAMLVVVLIITVRIHLPINRFIQSASLESIPDNWDEQRRRWREWNVARCGLAVLAFATVVLGRS